MSAGADLRPLLTLEESVDLAVSPDRAWDAIKDFDGIHRWHPGVLNTTLLEGVNNQPMAVRELDLGGGAWLMSELLDWNAAERRFRYRILKSPMPLVAYVAEMRVTPTSQGCRVTWKGQFKRRTLTAAPGADDATAMAAVTAVFRTGLDNLSQCLEP
jgi:mxaD protein